MGGLSEDEFADNAVSIEVPWSNESVFYKDAMPLFWQNCPSEAVDTDLWDWFTEHRCDPEIDYDTLVDEHLVAFTFYDESVALLFKLTFCGNL